MSTRLRTDTTDDVLLRLGEGFRRAGRQLYLVGGSVRDELIGRPHKDLDLATDAIPDETRAIVASTAPTAAFDVGARFGTIGALYQTADRTIPVEITTFRREAYEPGSRKPAVAFGTSLADDLARRDFTINAIARELDSGRLIDPFHGQDDLRDKLVRAVGDPAERFAEDPLRMLRAVRIAVELGFRIDEVTAGAIVRQSKELVTISRERVRDEFDRILVSSDPAGGLRTLTDLGLMRWIVPELLLLRDAGQGHRAKDLFDHTLRVVENTPPDLVLRWAGLLHDIAKPRTQVVEGGEVHYPGHERVGEHMARQILADLRLDGETTDRIGRLVGMHMRANQYEPEWTDGAVRRLMREAGAEMPALLELSRADVTSYRPQKIAAARARVEALRQRCERIAEQENIAALKSPLDGNDLMAMFARPPGRWIAAVKDYLLDLVIEGDLARDDRARAAELATAFLAAHDAAH